MIVVPAHAVLAHAASSLALQPPTVGLAGADHIEPSGQEDT
jgi:hypothetical protein